ncbi:MAG: nucleotidyltransferase domain-containing protein [Oligoflexia bacterium]|nr:nucleotidyltransferase domain-containing protein [Oligoflexia bacterium]
MKKIEKIPDVRLEQTEINNIQTVMNKCLKNYKRASLYCFGSRTNLALSGGDIDLLLNLQEEIDSMEKWSIEKKLKIELLNALGEQKIDILIETPLNDNPMIKTIEKKVLLWSNHDDECK